MEPEKRQPLRLSDVRPDGFYSQTQFAEVFDVHPTTVATWTKKHKLPLSKSKQYLGATILRFADPDAKALTITDREFTKRSKTAHENVKELVSPS